MFISVKSMPKDFIEYHPFLNGELIHGCFAADEELGIALCYEMGPDGKWAKDTNNPMELKKILLQGKIELKKIKREVL